MPRKASSDFVRLSHVSHSLQTRSNLLLFGEEALSAILKNWMMATFSPYETPRSFLSCAGQ
jgi:hypothetical protein